VAAAMAVPVMAGVAPAYAAAWQIVASPNSTSNDTLAGVTAFSPSNVWAVGYPTNLSTVQGTLIEHYNGSSWSIVPSPNPAGGRYDDLSSVAGTSVSDIWSVGFYQSSRAHTHPLAEHYNGSSWSLVAAPQPAQMDGFADVAPVTTTNVWAVGGGNTGTGITPPLVEHYDGSAWTVVPTSLTGPGWLNSVTATSANNIWAVGNIPSAGALSHTGLVMHYDGTSWTQVTIPAPTLNGDWQLTDVTATSASDVWAAGWAASSGDTVRQAIVEHYNGTSWSVTNIPPLSSGDSFNAVAAISPSNVWAIGDTSVNGQNAVLVEHFNGTSWSAQPAPSQSGFTLGFDSLVSPGNNGTLWAVGGKYPTGTTSFQTLTALLS
jgi:hypothetical protein